MAERNVDVVYPVEIAMLAMFHPWKNLSLGGAIALEFIGDDYSRHVGQPFKKLAKELFCSLLVAPTLHQDIKNVAVLLAA